MRADWTRPNQEIANYLASFGRFGIPFNAIYGPDAPDGIALPELLTQDIVQSTAARSGKSPARVATGPLVAGSGSCWRKRQSTTQKTRQKLGFGPAHAHLRIRMELRSEPP